jgi:metal-responsive CopG/Arc/MetJ family transcriptional regulator
MERGHKTERFGMVVEPQFLERIDQWRRKQKDIPSRAESIRRLVERALQSENSST